MSRQPSVLHLICPLGMYGAERWIVALISGLRDQPVKSAVWIPIEEERQREIADQFREAGCIVHTSDVIGAGPMAVLRALHDAVASLKPDVLHTHGYKTDVLGVMASRRAGIPVVSTPHGFGQPSSLKHKVLIGVGKFALRFADRVVPLSRQLQEEVLAAGVKASRVRLIHNAVDMYELAEAASAKQNRGTVIGFVGQMIPRKRVDHLLRIFDYLWKADQRLRLHLVGAGASEAALKQQASALASADAIEFFGFRRDRLSLMTAFDIFAMTSADEGVPRCLMEAMGMGVAAVGYDIPGVDDLILDGQTGLIVPSGDEQAFAAACQRLLAEPELRQSMAAGGEAHIEHGFSNRRMAREYVEVYRDVLGQGSGE